MIIKKLQQLKAKKGFTLVELLVVIAIIGILAAVLIPLMVSFLNNARISNANGTATTVQTMMQGWILDESTGQRPRGLEEGEIAIFYVTGDGSGVFQALGSDLDEASGLWRDDTGDRETNRIAGIETMFEENFADLTTPTSFVIVLVAETMTAQYCVGVAFIEGTEITGLGDFDATASLDEDNGGIGNVANGRAIGDSVGVLRRDIVGTYPSR